ncbi:MAG: caspase family protein [Ideonella sp.]|nr:caspase family protein [Ideonella sp.]MCC7455502.1 caspase family protein [Nitrospira sp.]
MDPQRRRWLTTLTLGALAPIWAATSSRARAATGSRLALVIGNADYKVGALKNPANDARAMADSLRGLGFDVTLRENASLREMLDAFQKFSISGQAADVRVVYYAGHGVQVKGRNYLLPVDTEIHAEDEMPSKSADLNALLERLGSIKRGINVVILDACRNNPFSGQPLVGPDGRALRYRGAAPSGLAPADAPLGSMVAFATAPGGVALDNPSDRHSLYTKHLLEQLQSPGLPVELLFKRVRLAVARETGGVQVPWESSSLTGDFCFRTLAGGACSGGR